MVHGTLVDVVRQGKERVTSVLRRLAARLACPVAVDLAAYAWLLDDGEWAWWCLAETTKG